MRGGWGCFIEEVTVDQRGKAWGRIGSQLRGENKTTVSEKKGGGEGVFLSRGAYQGVGCREKKANRCGGGKKEHQDSVLKGGLTESKKGGVVGVGVDGKKMKWTTKRVLGAVTEGVCLVTQGGLGLFGGARAGW